MSTLLYTYVNTHTHVYKHKNKKERTIAIQEWAKGKKKGRRKETKFCFLNLQEVSLRVRRGGKRCMYEGNACIIFCMFPLKSEEEINEWGIKTHFQRFKKEKPGRGCSTPGAQKLNEVTAVFWVFLLLLFSASLWFCGSLEGSYNLIPKREWKHFPLRKCAWISARWHP